MWCCLKMMKISLSFLCLWLFLTPLDLSEEFQYAAFFSSSWKHNSMSLVGVRPMNLI
jgi:hypothetical protein